MLNPTPGAPHTALAVTTTAQTLKQLGLTLNPMTTHVQVAADTADIRYTVNGTAPSATIGFPIRTTAWEVRELTRAQADAARFYAASAATLQVAEYRNE